MKGEKEMKKNKVTGGELYYGTTTPRNTIRQNVFQSLLPNLIKAINRLADAIEKQNVLKEEE